MKIFMWGALAMTSLVAALFFLRFWRASRERLFAFFALAFAGLATNYVGLAFIDLPNDEAHQEYAYVVRLVAFVIIIIGIIDKNHRSGGKL
jgi:ABC-type transport system involved in cytochrome c biogenesis permease subunit